MLEYGGEQLLLKLVQLFRGKDDLISSGRLKICLSATIISFLNKCFDDNQQFPDSQKHDVEFLKLCVQSVHNLKITAGPTFKYNCVVDISNFKSVQILEITKLAIGLISGLQTLRGKIKVLKTHHYSVDKINDVLASCGFDQSMEFLWPQLEEANFRFNKIHNLDSSLRLLTSLKSLNLSHNELALEDENWMYLPEVIRLDVSYNQITKIPFFTGSSCSRMTSLILGNNDLSSLEGVDALSNLEVLDVSTNCIAHFQSVTPLLRLNRLVSLRLHTNPISYHQQYRSIVVSCLSSSHRHVPIVLDGQQLSAEESHKLGSYLEADTSSMIPPRHYQSPVQMCSNQDSGDQFHETSTEEPRAPRTYEQKRKGRKLAIRQPSIHDVGEEQATTCTAQSAVSAGNVLEANEELQKLEKFKKDTGEDYLLVRNQQQIKDIKEAMVVNTSTDPGTLACAPQQETNTEEKFFPESPPANKNEMQSIEEDEEKGRIFLVSVKSHTTTEDGVPDLQYVFVTVKQHFIVEKDIKLKVICTLDLNSLLDVKMIVTEENVTVPLKFDYLNKEKMFREYIMEDEKCGESFVALVKDFVKQPDNDETKLKKQFKCLKCSASWSTLDEELSEWNCCDSSMVIEITQDSPVKNANSPQSKLHSLRPETFVETGPDIIPKAVNNSGATSPPDICINSSDKDRNHSSAEYGELVSSIRLKSKDVFTQNTFVEELPTEELLSSSNASSISSPAMDITYDHSSPGVVKSLYYKLRSSSNDPTQESSASSLSGSDSRTSTPVGGRRLRIHFSMDSCTHCDHRLKLYFETKMFNGGDDEEFCCMIKCPVVSHGCTQDIPSLLVISNFAAYICKITGFESCKPREWLSVKVSYLLTDLRYLEYGLQNQSFRLEFVQPSGYHTYLVGDTERCEDFLSTLQDIVKKDNQKSLTIGKTNPQTLANIRLQVFGLKDESLMLKGQRLYEQAVNFTDPPLVKDRKNWFRSLPQSMLGTEFVDWLISHKEASTFREAIQIGQLLLDADVIQCFNQDCRFLEKEEYYHFNLPDGTLKNNAEDLHQGYSTQPSDIDINIIQYVLAHWSPTVKKKDMENMLAISIIVSNTHIVLAEENHQWPLPRLHEPPVSLSGPQFVFLTKQKIINITDLELFTDCPRNVGIEFRDEDTPGNIEDDRWLLVMETEYSLKTFLDTIKELWEEKFGVDMPVNIKEC